MYPRFCRHEYNDERGHGPVKQVPSATDQGGPVIAYELVNDTGPGNGTLI